MEFLDPQRLRQLPSSAPALTRGLALWVTLCQESPLSLEELAARLQLPKASAFRLLESLRDLGLIRKLANKQFEPLWAPRPLEDDRQIFRQALEARMERLARETNCTVEWYEPHPEGLTLVIQNHPDSEVRVQARPGFLRRWDSEFEAVTRLGFAFAKSAPKIHSAQLPTANGVLRNLKGRELSRLLAEAREDQTASDAAFNTNGVRRCAAAVRDEATGDFRGVLAIAETFHFSRRSRQKDFLTSLQNALKS